MLRRYPDRGAAVVVIGPDGPGELRGGPTRVALAPAAVDAPAGRRLWEVSEQLTDVRFPSPAGG